MYHGFVQAELMPDGLEQLGWAVLAGEPHRGVPGGSRKKITYVMNTTIRQDEDRPQQPSG